jgi:hypothetical protein
MVHFPFLILSLSFDLSELPRSLQLNEIKDKKKKGTKGVGRYGALIVPTRSGDRTLGPLNTHFFSALGNVDPK